MVAIKGRQDVIAVVSDWIFFTCHILKVCRLLTNAHLVCCKALPLCFVHVLTENFKIDRLGLVPETLVNFYYL